MNKALRKLKEINPHYENVTIDDSWDDVSKQSDPELWKLLTDENAKNNDSGDIIDSDDEIDGNDHTKEKEQRISSGLHPTVLHNVDGPNISPSDIVNIAPGENQIPVSFTSEPDWEALAYPTEFSTGINHFNQDREVKITPVKYVHARLKCCDDRFAANPQYLFSMLDFIEKSAVESSIHFAQRKQFQTEVTAGQLRDISNVSNMISEDQIFASFKNIRGTPQYFKNMTYDVLAKIRQFGVFTFFLTFSAGEFYWTEVIQVAARRYGENLTDEQVNDMEWNTKLKYLQRNPVVVARQIDYIFQKLWGKVILSGMHPIGQILNYDNRSEFQKRGGEHIHSLIHVKDAPKIDENDDSEIIEFIDKYCTVALPNKDSHPILYKLVSTVETHKHTFTCRKTKDKFCRFGYPQLPSESTKIIRVQEVDKKKIAAAKKILDKVLLQLIQIDDLSTVTLSEILTMCDVSVDEYYNAVDEIQKKLNIIYKRKPSEVNIVQYNTVILKLLRANMNIQYVTGVYAVVVYLTSYLCKPEHTMSELMKKTAKEAHGADIKTKLRKISNVFLTKREVASHEAVKRSLSMHMRTSNLATEYIPTGPKKERTRILKPQVVLDTMDEEDTNVFAPSLLDKYENRPSHPDFVQMCYADFAANYISTKVVKVESDDIKSYSVPVGSIDDDEPEGKSTKIITLQNGLGKMKKRSRPIVIRFHNVRKLENSENYYRRLLQMYLPWRNEDNLKRDDQTYEDRYKEVENDISDNVKRHEPFLNIDYDELHNYNDILESSEDEEDCEYGLMRPDELLDLHTVNNNDDNDENVPPVAATTVSNLTLPNDEYYNMCFQLNEGQQHLFNFIMQWAVKYHFAETNAKPEPDPFYIFLSGGAGVGKSFLVNTITEYLKRLLRYTGQNIEEQPSVIVTASTGKAASNIGGTTLHSAFKLPLGDKWGGKSKPSHSVLAKLRNQYRYLMVILIDEISMCNYENIKHLNSTLQLIKNNKLDFGGVCLIAIGDFLQLPPVRPPSVFGLPNNKGNTYGLKFFNFMN